MKSIKMLSLLSIILVGAIYMSSCNKSTTAPATIVGTWTGTTEEQKLTVNGTQKYDTMIQLSTGQIVLIFTADGSYVQLGSNQALGGAYTYTGNTLSLFDTSHAANVWRRYPGTTLTSNKLSIIASVDTISFTPIDSISSLIVNLSK